ncbi:uncharacterized protein LOC122498123 [Leptopilina heterotoma]|uniref:uncharacterized protein LOC122498123 n=1 Tax=Leptopilina heterotoma TaxID=63436 RepID=UPI001CA83989|nr:uncharacterized protein LOC122498123 [Leptopilina heterotoma]
MNSTTGLAQGLPNSQFLPVCQYIYIFGIIFHKNGLLKLEQRSETVSVLNTFFEYINKSNNESEAKHLFLHNVLNQSGLYRIGSNQTLEKKYVEETYQHIICTTLFSSYGSINGYLSDIINKSTFNSHAVLKKTVVQHLSQNYVNEDYCSSQSKSVQLTGLASTKIFMEYIWPIFEEKNLSFIDDSDSRRILKNVLPNHNMFGIHKGLRKITKRSLGLTEEDFKKSLKVIRKFQKVGLSGMEKDWIHALRLILEGIYENQIKTDLDGEIDLFLSQTISNPIIVDFLASLKGKEFYFSDITFLTDIHADEINLNNSSSSSSETEVRYYMKFNSRYGLVDLASFYHRFAKKYIVFPEVVFSVLNTQFIRGKNILIMSLIEKQISKTEYMRIREKVRESLFIDKGYVESERAKFIQKAAFEISLRLPMKRILESELILKHFILKIDQGARDVPTYDMLAKDIYTTMTIKRKYVDYKIPFNSFMDHVLYKRKFYTLPDLEEATQKVNQIFGGNYMPEEVEPIWRMFRETVDIHELVFSEYCPLHPLLQTLVDGNNISIDRKEISLLKLAIRQCDEEWIKNPFTLYSFDTTTLTFLNELKRLNIGRTMEINIMMKFYLTVEDAWKNRGQRDSSYNKHVMYQIGFHNDAAIVNLSHLLQMPSASYHLPTMLVVKKDKMFKKRIENHNVNAIKLIPKQELKETLMVSLVKNLNLIYSKYKEECLTSLLENSTLQMPVS